MPHRRAVRVPKLSCLSVVEAPELGETWGDAQVSFKHSIMFFAKGPDGWLVARVVRKVVRVVRGSRQLRTTQRKMIVNS